MYNTVKRYIIAASALICALLCSCAPGKTATEKETREYETDFSKVNAELITIRGTGNSEFEEQLNSAIRSEEDSALVAFDSKAQESEPELRMGNKCVLEITWEEKYNANDFLSIVEESYTYTGGAHGVTARAARNIDFASQKEVRLGDLFAEAGYENTLNRMISEQIAEHPSEYSDLWAKAEIKDAHQSDFYISDGNLVIFFQPYDLSYYARGFVEFRLPLEELRGYMKEEYRRLT